MGWRWRQKTPSGREQIRRLGPRPPAILVPARLWCRTRRRSAGRLKRPARAPCTRAPPPQGVWPVRPAATRARRAAAHSHVLPAGCTHWGGRPTRRDREGGATRGRRPTNEKAVWPLTGGMLPSSSRRAAPPTRKDAQHVEYTGEDATARSATATGVEHAGATGEPPKAAAWKRGRARGRHSFFPDAANNSVFRAAAPRKSWRPPRGLPRRETTWAPSTAATPGVAAKMEGALQTAGGGGPATSKKTQKNRVGPSCARGMRARPHIRHGSPAPMIETRETESPPRGSQHR